MRDAEREVAGHLHDDPFPRPQPHTSGRVPHPRAVQRQLDLEQPGRPRPGRHPQDLHSPLGLGHDLPELVERLLVPGGAAARAGRHAERRPKPTGVTGALPAPRAVCTACCARSRPEPPDAA